MNVRHRSSPIRYRQTASASRKRNIVLSGEIRRRLIVGRHMPKWLYQ
jgi:hypothetical protein